MHDIIQNIMNTVDKKGVQSDCKKILKKCSFKSANDVGFITELAVWLYVYGYYDEAIKVCDIARDIEFDGNYTLWQNFDSLYCIKARILRERGNKKEADEIIDFVNKYRKPELYKNVADHTLPLYDKNIQSNLERNSKAGAKSWRLVKLEILIAYKEAGGFPIPEKELEKMIEELIEILAQEK